MLLQGVSSTVLKKACRKLGIVLWPNTQDQEPRAQLEHDGQQNSSGNLEDSASNAPGALLELAARASVAPESSSSGALVAEPFEPEFGTGTANAAGFNFEESYNDSILTTDPIMLLKGVHS
eukprot:29089-Rhodomonas_salina.2